MGFFVTEALVVLVALLVVETLLDRLGALVVLAVLVLPTLRTTLATKPPVEAVRVSTLTFKVVRLAIRVVVAARATWGCLKVAP